MIDFCKRISTKAIFHYLILLVIILNAVLLGLETSQHIMRSVGDGIQAINWAIQAIFVFEITVRILAHWPKPLSFFRNGWNLFDFVVVAVVFLPLNGSFVTVGRLLRLLRATRLVSVFPQLRLIINTMLLSIPSMGHVVLLLSLLLYIYGIAGFYLFHEADPQHWGSLSTALLSLFQVMTLEGWVELQQALLHQKPWAWVFFASFIVVAVFVVTNLFIAVVINNLEKAKEREHRIADANMPEHDLLARVASLKREIDELEAALSARFADRRPRTSSI
ncbi:MAG TPA: ion transporter [Phycisphaerae bacterium]|nr:ion transporter [Phycisphaerae bacterium]